jgi:ribose transport system permease protein
MESQSIADRVGLGMQRRIGFYLRREFLMLSVIVTLLVIIFFTTDNYFTFRNLRSFLLDFSSEVLVCAGMTILLIQQKFDLSVGAIAVAVGAVANILFRSNVNGYLTIAACILVGILCGAVNGLIVTRLKLNSFIATLATMGIYQSIGFLTFARLKVAVAPPEVNRIAEFQVLGIEGFIWIALIVLVLLGYLLNSSKYLRQSFFIGGNETSAALLGIKISRFTLFCFSLVGFLVGVSGAIIVLRLRMGSPSVGTTMALDVVAAAIIGGVSLTGGRGSILGASLGLILIYVIRTSLIFWGTDPEWQRAAVGVILILAATLDITITRRRGQAV